MSTTTDKSSKTIQLFEHDHSHALRKLRRLRQDIKGVREYKTIDVARESIQDFADFLEHALKTHFKQEEVALFPYLKQKMGEAYGPIDAMIDDHKQIDQAHATMMRELRKETPDLDELCQAADTILDVLEPHIDKEEEVIQPMALRLLTPEQLKEVDEKAKEIRPLE